MHTSTIPQPVRRALLAAAAAAIVMLALATPASAIPLSGDGSDVAQLTTEQLVLHWLGASSQVVSVTGGPGGIISGL